MKVYVLILIMKASHPGGAGLAVQEFNSERACINAGQMVQSAPRKFLRTIQYVCVPKGE